MSSVTASGKPMFTLPPTVSRVRFDIERVIIMCLNMLCYAKMFIKCLASIRLFLYSADNSLLYRDISKVRDIPEFVNNFSQVFGMRGIRTHHGKSLISPYRVIMFISFGLHFNVDNCL